MPDTSEIPVGVYIKYLNHAFARRFFAIAQQQNEDEVSMMHGRILALLCYRRGEDVFQRDIEEELHISRSSVAGIVKRMEERGYLSRQSVAGDARLKKLTPTPLGERLHLRLHRMIDETEALAVQGLTEEEQKTFCALAQKICDNLSEHRKEERL